MRLIVALGLVLAATGAVRAADPTFPSSAGNLVVHTVAQGLSHPWALAFLPDGRMLVTERPGRMRIVSRDGNLSRPLSGVPDVVARGQAGLLDVALDRDFATNRTIYFCFNFDSGGNAAVARAQLASDTALEDVKTFFRTYYAPNNATIAIVGDFQRDSVKRLVQLYFSGIPRGPAIPPRPQVTSQPVPKDTFLVLEDKVQLPRLYYAWRAVKAFHEDDAPLDVAAYVIAGDKNSRLYKRLVYDMQVAQDVSAFNNSQRLDGGFQIVVTPKPGHTPTEMAKLVNEELRKLTTDGITDRELARAQNSTRAQFLDRLASDLGKADQLNFYNYFSGTPDYARQDAARYDKVTVDDVKRVVVSYLGKPRVTLTVVPEGKHDLMVTGVVQ